MSWSWKSGLAGVAIVAATAYAAAQMPNHTRMHEQMNSGSPDQQHPMMQQGGPMMHDMQNGMHRHGMTGTTGQPIMPGQEAFGTIQEVVSILDADPTTDWSKVNISALREHLIDMDEVTMRATAAQRNLDDGVEIAVTGEGRTLDAIKRMVPAHTHELSQLGWNAKTEDLPNGVKLIVTSTDARQVVKLKALGFMGIMVQGAHHQRHHLMMAKSEFAH
ncbi:MULTISPECIES: hypothetical protein [Bradyrhizobium]|uniref:hypothetical protein n=1 Tax=Bradyrhizobium TaxID=374 RepID=UPI001B8A88A5|nr:MULTISPECIES: hypothetical protein [Bradyrhizobium]MBR0970434.1 hypothetical protein [Bradyrhizobium japonicum]